MTLQLGSLNRVTGIGWFRTGKMIVLQDLIRLLRSLLTVFLDGLVLLVPGVNTNFEVRFLAEQWS